MSLHASYVLPLLSKVGVAFTVSTNAEVVSDKGQEEQERSININPKYFVNAPLFLEVMIELKKVASPAAVDDVSIDNQEKRSKWLADVNLSVEAIRSISKATASLESDMSQDFPVLIAMKELCVRAREVEQQKVWEQVRDFYGALQKSFGKDLATMK